MASESVVAESERQPEAKLIAEREKEKTVTRKVRNLCRTHRVRARALVFVCFLTAPC